MVSARKVIKRAMAEVKTTAGGFSSGPVKVSSCGQRMEDSRQRYPAGRCRRPIRIFQEQEAGRLAKPGDNQHSGSNNGVTTLKDYGLSKIESSRAQRSVLALKLEDIISRKAKASYDANVGRPSKSPQNSAPITHIETRAELAKIANVSHDTIMKVKA